MVLNIITWLNWIFRFWIKSQWWCLFQFTAGISYPTYSQRFLWLKLLFLTRHKLCYRCITNYHDEILTGRLIWQKGPTYYSRSPDLNLFNFFFCGFLKNKIYFKKLQTIAELWVCIRKNVTKWNASYFSTVVLNRGAADMWKECRGLNI